MLQNEDILEVIDMASKKHDVNVYVNWVSPWVLVSVLSFVVLSQLACVFQVQRVLHSIQELAEPLANHRNVKPQ